MKRIISLALAVFAFIAVFYPVAIYSDFPFIKKWRTIYIETAMTTLSHKWLATAFIPGFVIDDVMNENKAQQQKQVLLTSSWQDVNHLEAYDIEPALASSEETFTADNFYNKFSELNSPSFKEFLSTNEELLQDGYQYLFIDNSKGKFDIKTVLDEKVYLLDCKNNLLIVEVTGNGYVGKLAIIKDSSQVSLAKSKSLGNYGTILRDFYTQNDALLAINCSGFEDEGATGNGGKVVGSLIINGKEYGKPNSRYLMFGQKNDNKFYIEQYGKSETSEYRWASQFSPALIVNGEKQVKGSFGYGLQPRSAVGQSENGDMLLLIIDGRQVGYSIGATVSDLADIMLSHNAYQAVNLDGGSSSLMWYNSKNITKPSSTNNLGRYLPNAIIVTRAEEKFENA